MLDSSVGDWVVVALSLASTALGGVVFVLLRQQHIVRQYQRLMVGTSGGNLEALLHEYVDLVRETASLARDLDRRVKRLEEASAYDLQRLAVVRYNPFNDTGGDQSFAVALTDDRGDGVVLSSLHARDMTRVYAKPLGNWVSAYSLTDEEKEAIDLARRSR